ncbi:peptidylprolyl isomerase [Acetobacteraceae bacterium]|nr:peptidylprolyl isomerase [Acetobacteraceae bacterium]
MKKYSLSLCWLPLALFLCVFSAQAEEITADAQDTLSPSPKADSDLSSDAQILAVVNGQLLTRADVEDRARLFVVSTGLPIAPSVMKRMRSQILQQLIQEKLKTQEVLRRHIDIPPEQIAASIANIEERNDMPHNALRDKLAKDDISLTTLIDQIRAQSGWMVVLRQTLGARSRVLPDQIKQRQKALEEEEGEPQYLMNEIFIPVADSEHPQKEIAFANMIISQLRGGAPFPIVAAQFSQDQSALNGGSLGWMQEDHLDPAVVEIIKKMPDEAISNPILVPGGLIISTVHARRKLGKEMGTLITLRQAFFPFSSPLNPEAPTEEQKALLQQANEASATVHSCKDMEELNDKLGARKAGNPGTQVMERLPPQMHSILEKLPNKTSTKPLVAGDGISLLMICTRQSRNLAQLTPGQIADQLMNERIEQAARQLQRALQRKAVIEIRPAGRAELNA